MYILEEQLKELEKEYLRTRDDMRNFVREALDNFSHEETLFEFFTPEDKLAQDKYVLRQAHQMADIMRKEIDNWSIDDLLAPMTEDSVIDTPQYIQLHLLTNKTLKHIEEFLQNLIEENKFNPHVYKSYMIPPKDDIPEIELKAMRNGSPASYNRDWNTIKLFIIDKSKPQDIQLFTDILIRIQSDKNLKSELQHELKHHVDYLYGKKFNNIKIDYNVVNDPTKKYSERVKAMQHYYEDEREFEAFIEQLGRYVYEYILESYSKIRNNSKIIQVPFLNMDDLLPHDYMTYALGCVKLSIKDYLRSHMKGIQPFLYAIGKEKVEEVIKRIAKRFTDDLAMYYAEEQKNPAASVYYFMQDKIPTMEEIHSLIQNIDY